ncbi:MAG: hypothetical protein A2W31_16485 [Planctomycetes bacterium RBG_16_64_10]|nr:MAG: hypothetical protein A2W31_16485 [Planctomycetes bacterium RBG_16_64_10]
MPLAFMGRLLRDILATPFEELSATPGVGQKKIAGLIMLLHRATKDTPPDDPFGLEAAAGPARGQPPLSGDFSFNPLVVSEALWAQWRETVKRHNLGQLKLGRLAPSLAALPTVIWHTPLEDYADLTLADIRSLKTHGEKRVRAVLEVFCAVHETLARSVHQDHLDVDLVPKFVRPVERWTVQALTSSALPGQHEIRASLIGPLLAQVKVDVGPTVWRLASERLGMEGRAHSVRYQAKQMGVTRARVYQLLEECGKVMAVRWPEGESMLTVLIERYRSESPGSDAARLLCAATDLFFPRNNEPLRVVASRLRIGTGLSPVVVEPADSV